MMIISSSEDFAFCAKERAPALSEFCVASASPPSLKENNNAHMLGGWVNPHREQQTIPQGQTSSPPNSFFTPAAKAG